MSCKISAGAETAFDKIAFAAGEAAGKIIGDAMTWWLNTPSVDPDSSTVRNLQQYVVPIAVAILVGSVLVQALRMTLTRKKDPAINVGLGLIRYAIVTTIGLTLLALALKAGDEFASWLVSQAVGDFADRMSALLNSQVISNPFLLLLMSVIAAVLGVIQWVLGLLRQGGILVLAVLLPLAASGSINDSTKAWMNRLMPWLISLVAYKPIAALIYAIGFGLMGGGQDLSTVMTGLVVLILATVAMPAMMRFFAWSQVQVSSGSGAGGVLAAGATGAASIAALQASKSMTNSGPGTGPSGATTQSGPSPSHSPGSPGGVGGQGRGGRSSGSDAAGGPGGATGGYGSAESPGGRGATGSPVPTGAGAGGGAATSSGAAGGGTAAGGGAAAAGPVGAAVVAAGAAANAAKAAGNTAKDSFTDGRSPQ